MKAMRGLKERERIILQMRYGIEHEELTQKDIAKTVGHFSVLYFASGKKNFAETENTDADGSFIKSAVCTFFIVNFFLFPITYNEKLFFIAYPFVHEGRLLVQSDEGGFAWGATKL